MKKLCCSQHDTVVIFGTESKSNTKAVCDCVSVCRFNTSWATCSTVKVQYEKVEFNPFLEAEVSFFICVFDYFSSLPQEPFNIWHKSFQSVYSYSSLHFWQLSWCYPPFHQFLSHSGFLWALKLLPRNLELHIISFHWPLLCLKQPTNFLLLIPETMIS